MYFEPIVQRRAEALIHHQQIPFFDFFRSRLFGFVQTEAQKGHYVSVGTDSGEMSDASCNCPISRRTKVCEHAAAIYLLAHNWPLSPTFLPSDFYDFEPYKFLSQAAPKSCSDGCTDYSINQFESKSRLKGYFFDPSGKQALRDLREREKAMQMERSAAEKTMISRGVSSQRCLFEQSRLYQVAKASYLLHLKGHLNVKLGPGREHRLYLRLLDREHCFFEWELPVDQFLSMAQSSMDYWSPKLEFGYQPIALETVYQMAFNPKNQLEVQPGICWEGNFVPFDQLDRVGNMFHHAGPGYFYSQTRLSSFELEHANQATTLIENKVVPTFLKAYEADIQDIDQRFLDESLLGHSVISQFDEIAVEVVKADANGVHCDLKFRLSDLWFTHQVVREQIKSQPPRYWNFQNRFFDSKQIDGHVISNLFRETSPGNLVALTRRNLLTLAQYFRGRIRIEAQDKLAKHVNAMIDMRAEETLDLGQTNLDLRPYQEIGAEWLWFLFHAGIGGLLCDQMGLGKTHQAMALFSGVKAYQGTLRGLVICPTSVLFHWKDKLRTFCPALKVELFHGTQRAELDLSKPDILVTTYGTMRAQSRPLHDQEFDVVVLDEIQNVKNRQTQTHRSLEGLIARCRVGLTGTPIENHLRELKSLMDMVMPGYLGPDTLFRDTFEVPILRNQSQHAKTLLKDLTAPFILRRDKSEVLSDLPEKTETILTIDLHPWERNLYDGVLNEEKERLREKGRPEFVHVFQLINRLKQLCDHPALYYGHSDASDYASHKWDVFVELLENLLAAGEKTVVFTQYLGMIDLMKAYLEERGYPYACITGSVTNRAEQQARFQSDPQCMVFLGSLNAAGVGIDLTAGSALIHYDRWWNPAREEQATDRVHRIGQNRPVQVYKLMTRGTIEERINELIESKKSLLSDLVDFDPETAGKTLSLGELLKLIS